MFTTIAIILLFLLLVWFLFKLLKSVIKVAIISVIVIIVSLTAVGYLVYKDVKGMGQGFAEEEKLCLLQEKGEVLLATVIHGSNSTEFFTAVTGSDLQRIESLYQSNKMKDLRGDYYRVFVFDMDFFGKGLPDIIAWDDEELGNLSMPKSTALTILRSDDPLSIMTDWMVSQDDSLRQLPEESARNMAREQLLKDLKTTEDLRSAVFFISLNSVVEDKGPAYLVKEYREGTLDVYPRSIVFWIAREAPGLIVDPLLNSTG
jgi:hypothetical protein